ncbi:glucosylceramidase 4 [Brachionus plicatilis]|uniref:Glucosylceramidase 4 n=1 Tax=Brachionus plicatilis TaxID=10195 RepID=A0A3M7Q360_BRAPC|nr:glucosylceramidase 4 [Brachionus plicatilis]
MTKINSYEEEAISIRVYAKEARIWSNTEKNENIFIQHISTTQQAKKGFDHKDNISQRQVANKFDISQQMVSKLFKKLQITPKKKMKILDRTETQKKVARVKCRNLNLKNPNISWILDDESYITLSHVTLLQHQQVQNIPQLRDLSRNYLFGWSFMRGHHSDGNYKFWPDLASFHYANTVINYLIDQNIKYVQKCENPANVPEVRPTDDFWSILKEKVCKNVWRAKNLDELRNKIRLCTRNMD